MNEIWKPVKNYEDLYLVSNIGNIRRKGKDKNRKYNINKSGYVLVNLYNNGKYKNLLVHRLVALAFIPNPENKPEVNHKDGNKLNNNADNLEWVTEKENVVHSYKKLGRIGFAGNKGNKDKITEKTKPVIQYDLNNKFIRVWASKEYASRKLKLDSASISNCCRGKRKSVGNFKWRYAEDEIKRLNFKIENNA